MEKNELREEKASLKSDIENLNAQYQQRVRVMFPWGAMDPSVVMAPPYSYPMPVAVPPGPIPMHPSLQPFPYYQTQNPATVPNPCPTFVSYPTPINPAVEQPLAQPQYASVSHVSSKQDSKSKSSDHPRGGNAERCDDSNEVATELVLKMPGSSAHQVSFNFITLRSNTCRNIHIGTYIHTYLIHRDGKRMTKLVVAGVILWG